MTENRQDQKRANAPKRNAATPAPIFAPAYAPPLAQQGPAGAANVQRRADVTEQQAQLRDAKARADVAEPGKLAG